MMVAMINGEGERIETQRRRRFWRLILGLTAIGAIGGFLAGFVNAQFGASGDGLNPMVQALAAIALIIALAGGAFATWRFFQTMDEVEVSDNLWASLIGFYVYGFGFPGWMALYWLDVAPQPVDWTVYAASMLTAAGAYGVRKWRSR